MLKTARSHSLTNNNSNSNGSEILMNMETIIKQKNSKIKNFEQNQDETINNFASYMMKNGNETASINNRTQQIQKNIKKHLRRCSINSRVENSSNCFPQNFNVGLENQESLKKISLEFLKKIFDVKAPFAAKRKHLLKEFLYKKLSKKVCEEVQMLIEKEGDVLSRETLNSLILGLIGKDNENYILIFNYLFNPDSLYLVRKGKN